MAAAEDRLGTESIGKLLIRQAVPASIGILFMTVNFLIDAIFVGRWVGSVAIAALTVIGPVMLIFASVGLAVGVGGSSVISRALGDGKKETAFAAFAHQLMILVALCTILLTLGLLFTDDLLALLGANGKILEPAKIFLYPILVVAPFMAFTIMGSGVMRAENKSGFSMVAMMIAAVGNIVLDILLIRIFDFGIEGAAWATAISLFVSFLFTLWFFLFKSQIKLQWSHFALQPKLLSEIAALSATTFARQSVISILSVLLNHTLFAHGGEQSVTIYGIVSRLLQFALFPVSGIVEGFLPIAGFNYGAKKTGRVRESINLAIKYAGMIAIVIYTLILIFAKPVVNLFTDDAAILKDAPAALRWVFAASPIIAIQLIGSAYFQAAGKAAKALLLTLTKQGFFLIPLILILPNYFGIFGVWISFPIADILATIVTGIFLKTEMNAKLKT